MPLTPGARLGSYEVLGELETRSRTRFVSGVDVAVVAAGLGDTEKALDALERAFDQRSSSLVWWIGYPCFDSLHGQPRFQALTRRLGLPASVGAARLWSGRPIRRPTMLGDPSTVGRERRQVSGFPKDLACASWRKRDRRSGSAAP